MVDVRPTNDKLRNRAVRIVQAVTGAGPEPAGAALVAAGWDVKVACLIVASGRDAAAAGSSWRPPMGGCARHWRYWLRTGKDPN